MKDSTLSRLSEFRQLKKEIRGSDKHLIIGIDVPRILSMQQSNFNQETISETE